MRDQLSHLPPQLPAAMLWGGQSKEEARFILQSLSVCSQPLHINHMPCLEGLTGPLQGFRAARHILSLGSDRELP